MRTQSFNQAWRLMEAVEGLIKDFVSLKGSVASPAPETPSSAIPAQQMCRQLFALLENAVNRQQNLQTPAAALRFTSELAAFVADKLAEKGKGPQPQEAPKPLAVVPEAKAKSVEQADAVMHRNRLGLDIGGSLTKIAFYEPLGGRDQDVKQLRELP